MTSEIPRGSKYVLKSDATAIAAKLANAEIRIAALWRVLAKNDRLFNEACAAVDALNLASASIKEVKP